MISIGQVAALIAAIGFALLMLALCYVVLKLAKRGEGLSQDETCQKIQEGF